MKAVTVPSPYGASSSSCHHYNNYRVVILMAKSKKSQPASSPNKGSEPAPPRITSNVKQNLQFLKLWKEFQKKKSSTPRPSTSYRRKKVEKEDLPDDTELYRDPTLSLYYTNQIVDTGVPVLLVDGYNVCGYWAKLKKHFMNGRLDIARQKLINELVAFSMARDISGGSRIESFFGQVVRTHGSAKNLPASCTSKMRPELCFFPQYVAQTMRTPLFVINSAYDSWQIKNILAPTSVDSKKEWKNCKLDLKKCSATQLQTVQNYRTQFLKAVSIGLGTSSRGLWINSCYAHCQSGSVSTWLADKSPVVGNAKMGKAVGDWFYDRSAFEKIDCPYPCNPTCISVDSES